MDANDDSHPQDCNRYDINDYGLGYSNLGIESEKKTSEPWLTIVVNLVPNYSFIESMIENPRRP